MEFKGTYLLLLKAALRQPELSDVGRSPVRLLDTASYPSGFQATESIHAKNS